MPVSSSSFSCRPRSSTRTAHGSRRRTTRHPPRSYNFSNRPSNCDMPPRVASFPSVASPCNRHITKLTVDRQSRGGQRNVTLHEHRHTLGRQRRCRTYFGDARVRAKLRNWLALFSTRSFPLASLPVSLFL